MGFLSVIRRWALRDKMPIREISRRTGLSRNTIRKYLREGAVSYARKLVTAWSGGVLKLLDPVLEFDPFNDLWHAVCPIKFSPLCLR